VRGATPHKLWSGLSREFRSGVSEGDVRDFLDQMLMLLLNAEIYDPRLVGRRHLLIAAGKILWMGQQPPQLDDSLAVEVSDLEGLRVIPGIIDGHAHITGGGGESGYSSRIPPLPLQRFTRAGVTTVVGLLGTDDVTRNTATLVAGARGLREEGLSAYCHTGGYHVPPITLTGSVRSDIVHIDPIIGVGEVAISDHRSSQPTLDELLRIAGDAHVAGMMTGKAGIVHLHLGDGERGLQLVRQALDKSEIPARVFNPTHVNRRRELFDEALSLAERGCSVDVTAYPVRDGDKGWSAEAAIGRYLDSGLPGERITVSSDGGGCLPQFDADGTLLHMDVGSPGILADTLGKLLDSGLALESVLPAFTSNPARLLRLPHKGTISVGADADLIVLGEDASLRHVMALGRWHVLDGVVMIKPTIQVARE
jgi:beta-aspartyl-dipeptidase (metallo-type)